MSSHSVVGWPGDTGWRRLPQFLAVFPSILLPLSSRREIRKCLAKGEDKAPRGVILVTETSFSADHVFSLKNKRFISLSSFLEDDYDSFLLPPFESEHIRFSIRTLCLN